MSSSNQDFLVSAKIREQACELLIKALQDERLTEETFQERSRLVAKAATFKDINAVLWDLPARILPQENAVDQVIATLASALHGVPAPVQSSLNDSTDETSQADVENSELSNEFTGTDSLAIEVVSSQEITYRKKPVGIREVGLGLFGSVVATTVVFLTMVMYQMIAVDPGLLSQARLASAPTLLQVNNDIQQLMKENPQQSMDAIIAKYNADNHVLHMVAGQAEPKQGSVSLSPDSKSNRWDAYTLKISSKPLPYRFAKDLPRVTGLYAAGPTDQNPIVDGLSESQVQNIEQKLGSTAQTR